MAELTSELAGLLIGASTTLATYWMPRVIEEFKRAHPRVIPRLVVGTSQLTQQRVLERELDLGIIEIAPDEPGLDLKQIGRDELWAILRGHPRRNARAAPVRAKELAAYPFIQRDPGNGIREIAETFFASAGIAPESLTVAAEIGTLQVKHLVAAGIGVAIAARGAARRVAHGAAGGYAARSAAIYAFRAHRAQGSFVSRLIMTFVDFLQERIRAMEQQLPSAEFFFGR